MNFQKITKKDFISILSEKANVLLFGGYLHNENQKKQIFSQLEKDTFSDIENGKFRTVKKVFSNHILFSDNGSLYLDSEGKKEYYKSNNILIRETVLEGSENFCIYLIK